MTNLSNIRKVWGENSQQYREAKHITESVVHTEVKATKKSALDVGAGGGDEAGERVGIAWGMKLPIRLKPSTNF